MAIWDWALEAYGRPGVPQACLALQDEHGQNTSFLLWAAYGGLDDPQLLAQGAAAAKTWDGVALKPLREVRRSLKTPLPPVADAAREAVREEVKRLELAAERLLMETLEALAPARGKASALEALDAAARAWGAPPPRNALAALAAALS